MSGEFEPFFVAISDDQPSGADLEYDPEFARMEKAAKGVPEQAVGSSVIEAQPPDWDEVRDAALNLLARSKDLRVATNLAQAELYSQGIAAFSQALQVIDVFVNQFWDSVFPELDADDDDDPTIRINSLMALNDVGGVVRQLRSSPILRSRSVGQFSLLHVVVAKGEAPAPAEWENSPTLKQINAAVHSCELGELQQAYQATLACLQYTKSIENAFSERLGIGTGPNFEALDKELKSIAKQQKAWLDDLEQSQPLAPAQQPEGSNALTTIDSRAAVMGQREGVPMVGGPLHINCREDVIDALDKIIRWLERYEPSSPLPMLLRRAKRLSNMSFLEILRDISPGGIDQALLISGADAEEDYSGTATSEPLSAENNAVRPHSAPSPPPHDDY